MFIVVSITGLHGEIPLRFSLMAPSGEIIHIDGKANSSDMHAVLDVVVDLRDLPVNEYGTYSVDVLTNEVELASRRFEVKPREES